MARMTVDLELEHVRAIVRDLDFHRSGSRGCMAAQATSTASTSRGTESPLVLGIDFMEHILVGWTACPNWSRNPSRCVIGGFRKLNPPCEAFS